MGKPVLGEEITAQLQPGAAGGNAMVRVLRHVHPDRDGKHHPKDPSLCCKFQII